MESAISQAAAQFMSHIKQPCCLTKRSSVPCSLPLAGRPLSDKNRVCVLIPLALPQALCIFSLGLPEPTVV